MSANLSYLSYQEKHPRLSAAWVAWQLGGDARPNAAGWYRCSCPAHHGDAADTLALRDGAASLAVKCFKGCSRASIINAVVAGMLGGRFNRTIPRRVASGVVPAEADRQAAFLRAAQRIWDETEPIDGTLAERRLRDRGITIALPDTLRFHAGIYHAGAGVHAPAMIAAVFDAAGNQTAIYRTWLDPVTATTARFAKPKMALCSVGGGAVRLGEPGSTVAVTEGIETGLSLMEIIAGTGFPVWAALSASGLRGILLPSHIRNVLIGADHDDAGLAAADALRTRLLAEGRTARVITPQMPDWDFNDELRRGGGR